MNTEKNVTPTTMKLIVSEESSPKIEVKPGMKFRVETIEIVDANFKPAKAIAARLCGSSSSCVALVEL